MLIVIGYTALESLDQWIAKKARAKAIEDVIDDELFGWEPYPEAPEDEIKRESLSPAA